jgi:hypothetical protein
MESALYKSGVQRLMVMTGTVPDLLAGDEAALQLAYQQQCQACVYRRPV